MVSRRTLKLAALYGRGSSNERPPRTMAQNASQQRAWWREMISMELHPATNYVIELSHRGDARAAELLPDYQAQIDTYWDLIKRLKITPDDVVLGLNERSPNAARGLAIVLLLATGRDASPFECETQPRIDHVRNSMRRGLYQYELRFIECTAP
jgi:hypothetical protein